MLQENDAAQLDQFGDHLYAGIKRTIEDANGVVRANGRGSFAAFKKLWPDRAEKY